MDSENRFQNGRLGTGSGSVCLALAGEQRRDHRNSGVLGPQRVSEVATEVFFNRLRNKTTLTGLDNG